MITTRNEQYLNSFHNYLDKRVNILTKPYSPIVPISKTRRPLPNDVKLRVLQNQRFNDYLDKISTDKHDRQKKVFETLQILSEMAFDRKLLVVRGLGSILEKLMSQLYSAVHINDKTINNLKESMGNHQTIYLPCHRSYVDFMLMSFMCFLNDIEIPCIAAGMDFYNMKFVGEGLRKTGAFFMRRTFGDEFYWNIFKEYMHEIITYNDYGLEFFIEGTRSRTCKALWPKLGLLSMSLEPYFMGEVHDLKIVPVAISYEKVLEEQLFVYELLGIPKPKESTKSLFKAVTTLKSKSYGNLYFDFCEPIYLNHFFGNKVDKLKHSSEPTHIQKLDSDEIQLMTDLAHHVLRHQQNKIIIMAYNLICLIYNEKVFTSSVDSLTFGELKREVLRLTGFFEELGAIVALNENEVEKIMRETINLHDNILEIYGNNSKIQLKKGNTATTRNSNQAKLKGHWLCKEIMDITVPVFSLQLYCNPTIYWLSQPAIFVLATIGSNQVSIEELKKDVLWLRQVFIYEFVLYQRFENEEFDETLKKLLDLKILYKSSETVSLNEKSPYVNSLLSSISPFFNCYLNTSEIILSKFKGIKFIDKDVFIAVQSTLEQELLKGNVSIHPYAMCLESMTTTLLSLCNSQCLFKEKKGSVNQYSIEEANFPAFVDRLRCFNSKLNFSYIYFSNIVSSKF